jgi:hypothetical protein
VSIVCLLAVFIGTHAPATAAAECSNTCYVDALSGLDSNSGELGFPKQTIQAAIDQVNAGGEVIVAGGTYEEQVTVTKSLSLLGPNSTVSGMGTRVPEATVQFPAGAVNGSSLIFVNPNVHGVTISGFDLRAQDETIPNYHQLIRAGGFSAGDPRNDLTIRNNRMYSSEEPIRILAGFGTKGGTGLLIEGNYIDGGPNVNSSFGRGIYAGGTSGVIQDNVIVNVNLGIQYMPYDNAVEGLIQRNIVSANNIGLYNNFQTLGAGPVTWKDNEVSIAANDRLGLKAEVDGAWTQQQQLNFRGIFAFTFGTQGSGSAPQAFFLNNKLDGATTSLFYSGTTGFGSGSSDQTNGQGTATLTENSFENFQTLAFNRSTVAPTVATCNWWGTTAVTTAGFEGNVGFDPFLVNGTDNSPAIGFQPGFQPGVECGPPPVAVTLSGFFQPVDMNEVLNVVKAGRAVPLKFRLTDTDGNGVEVPGLDVVLRAHALACSAGSTTDLVSETTAGGSGLQYLGDGNYQMNWKTPTAYARSCKTLTLEVEPPLGYVFQSPILQALFQFTR